MPAEWPPRVTLVTARHLPQLRAEVETLRCEARLLQRGTSVRAASFRRLPSAAAALGASVAKEDEGEGAIEGATEGVEEAATAREVREAEARVTGLYVAELEERVVVLGQQARARNGA